MPDSLADAEAELAKFNNSHRAFFVAVTRAISLLGGRARKRDVTIKLRELLAHEFTEKQLDYLETNNRFAWVRMNLKEVGLVGGEYGWWELSELGRAHAAAHAHEPLIIDLEIPEAREPAPRNQVTETVDVTAQSAYEIPLLEAMAAGHTERGEIMSVVRDQLADVLRPGDLRLMPGGIPVFEYRTAWTLSNLGKAGLAENPSTGQWKITPTGRQHLEDGRPSWNFQSFAPARSKVRVEIEPEGGGPPTPPPQTPPEWDIRTAWAGLRPLLGKALHDAITMRLSPLHGASPERAVPRNLIFYGPPGTGKTHIAKQIAEALTGDRDADDAGQFRLVQFHPSYAYEDFIQGLRPDIKQTNLRYELTKGPFSVIAEAASQDPDKFYVLVIDEINRGDPARIFGELLYALEYRGEAVSLALGGKLIVPPNLVVLGTMNSVDRSVALVDYALRRRFGFVRIDPNPEAIASAREPGLIANVGPGVLDKFNQWITKHLDRDHQIGHSFFLSEALADDESAFPQLWEMDIRPLLEEYLFGDDAALRAAAASWAEIVQREIDDRKRLEAEDVAT